MTAFQPRRVLQAAVVLALAAPVSAAAGTFHSYCMIIDGAGLPSGKGKTYITPMFTTESKITSTNFYYAFKAEVERRGFIVVDPFPCYCDSHESRTKMETSHDSYIRLATEGSYGGKYKKQLIHVDWQPSAELIAAGGVLPTAPPESAEQRTKRQAAEAERKIVDQRAIVERAEQAARARAEQELVDARLRTEREAQRRDEAAQEVKRGQEVRRTAIASATDARLERDQARAPSRKCMTPPWRGDVAEFGRSAALAGELLARRAARMCGKEPAALSNNVCDGLPGWVKCSADYYCPPRPMVCVAGTSRQ